MEQNNISLKSVERLQGSEVVKIADETEGTEE